MVEFKQVTGEETEPYIRVRIGRGRNGALTAAVQTSGPQSRNVDLRLWSQLEDDPEVALEYAVAQGRKNSHEVRVLLLDVEWDSDWGTLLDD